MTDQDKKYLSDILLAIELIRSFTKDLKDFKDYSNDLKSQSAVERQLGIIGEAVIKYEKLVPDRPLELARKIAGFRNRLIHSYDAIDQTIVWTILRNYLGPLESDVISRLNKND